jgi:hypothetical protein
MFVTLTLSQIISHCYIVGSDEGSDQEREWEDQQIQKGVSVIQQVN